MVGIRCDFAEFPAADGKKNEMLLLLGELNKVGTAAV